MDFRNIFDSFFDSKRSDNFYDQNNAFTKDFNDFESEFNRDFEDIVHNFGQMFEILNQFSVFNDINDSNQWPELRPESKSPRDLMLKSNEEMKKQDLVLDERVRRRGLDSIFKENPISESDISAEKPQSFRKSYFYSSFNNNGRFEEQKTTTDEFGNTETSVVKRIGGQSFTQITKRNNKNEIIETKEVIDNLDPNDLNVFKEKFNQKEDSKDENQRNKMTSKQSPLLNRIFDFWSNR